jgi:hypothetical protein
VVSDVPRPGRATVTLPDGRVLTQVSEDKLETVVPSAAGSMVMVVRGPHRGQRARLLQRDESKQRAAVQLVDDDEQIVYVGLADASQQAGE